MFRKAVSASLIVLGAAGGAAAQAADEGPRLVNRNGNQEVVYGSQANNVVGGAHATITGGGDNATYQAAPAGARFGEPRLIPLSSPASGIRHRRSSVAKRARSA